MADKMTFPKTIQEFIKSHSFKDSDEVYTNGSQLIQVFRVEQALEHYGQNAESEKTLQAAFNKLDEEYQKLREELRIARSDNETLKNVIVKLVVDRYGT